MSENGSEKISKINMSMSGKNTTGYGQFTDGMPNSLNIDRTLDISSPVNNLGNSGQNINTFDTSRKQIVGGSNFKSLMNSGRSKNGVFPPQMSSSKINFHD